MGIRLREVIGLCGPAPFDGSLDTPSPGVVSGHAGCTGSTTIPGEEPAG